MPQLSGPVTLSCTNESSRDAPTPNLARNRGAAAELGRAMLERRSGTDRRSGEDRRRVVPDGAAARIIAFLDDERILNGDRRVGERRSGLDRRAPQPELVRVRRR